MFGYVLLGNINGNGKMEKDETVFVYDGGTANDYSNGIVGSNEFGQCGRHHDRRSGDTMESNLRYDVRKIMPSTLCSRQVNHGNSQFNSSTAMLDIPPEFNMGLSIASSHPAKGIPPDTTCLRKIPNMTHVIDPGGGKGGKYPCNIWWDPQRYDRSSVVYTGVAVGVATATAAAASKAAVPPDID
jgi:hypothetical protein